MAKEYSSNSRAALLAFVICGVCMIASFVSRHKFSKKKKRQILDHLHHEPTFSSGPLILSLNHKHLRLFFTPALCAKAVLGAPAHAKAYGLREGNEVTCPIQGCIESAFGKLWSTGHAGPFDTSSFACLCLFLKSFHLICLVFQKTFLLDRTSKPPTYPVHRCAYHKLLRSCQLQEADTSHCQHRCCQGLWVELALSNLSQPLSQQRGKNKLLALHDIFGSSFLSPSLTSLHLATTLLPWSTASGQHQ